ncbi:MAG: NAD-dependent epimerase/dehydratase family protein [Chitinophagaceae bacterium]
MKVIITGATGMVGEGVLHQCLLNNNIDEVLVVNRKPCGINHQKLKEIIHPSFFDLKDIESELTNYDACFFCLGVSSVGMKEAEYFKLTHTLTMHFAQTLVKLNSSMIFCYISGASTDSTEMGKIMWARVKGKTENDLMKLPFKNVYNFRPAIITPIKGAKNTLKLYKYFGWLLPIIKIIFPNYIISLTQLGDAMINAATKGYPKQILEVSDIALLAKD